MMRSDGQWELMKRIVNVEDKDGWLVGSSEGYLEYPKRVESNIAIGLYNQLWDSKPHRHLYHEMVLVLRGCCLHEYKGVQVPLIPGDAFLVYPHESHGYHVDSPMEILNIWFYPERLNAGLTETLGYIRENTRILSRENADQERWHIISDISGSGSGQPQIHQNRQNFLNQQGIVYLNAEEKSRKDAVAKGVDCIIGSPSDSDGCASIVDIATEAGIPCVMVNTEVNNDKPYFFVGSDHYDSGRLQGEYIRDNIDDTETLNICYLEGTPGFNHTTLRKAGIFDVLDEAGYNYELLSSLTGEYYRDKGIDITEDWITQYGDKIDIIAAANDEMAMGALQAVKAAGLTDIKILGIDANDDALEAISNDELAFTVFQNAEGQGEWGAIAAYAASKGKEPEVLSIPYEPVSKDNLSDYWTP